MLDAQIELALAVARETWPDAAPVRMTNVKVRSFTPPGAQLTLTADVHRQVEREATFNLSAQSDGRLVATARVVIAGGMQ
jgi:predicted thioesterase